MSFGFSRGSLPAWWMGDGDIGYCPDGTDSTGKVGKSPDFFGDRLVTV